MPEAFAEEFSSHQMGEIARVKRFREAYLGDAEWRARLDAAGSRAGALARAEGFEVDVDALRPFMSGGEKVPEASLPPVVRLWRSWEKFRHSRYLRGLPADTDPVYASWWKRQVARCRLEVGESHPDRLSHFSLSIELSRGCSVGCWFCGVSAGRFGGFFAFTPENAAFWRESLGVLGDALGPALKRTLLYWATEPADNPDYASFVEDFYRISGTVPQTTTARPLKDAALTRRLLALRAKNGDMPDRFSVLSTRELRRIHTEFSAEDLLFVNLVLQNEGALAAPNGRCGRAGMMADKAAAQGRDVKLNADQPTIACVSGFLLNLMDRTVKLISPCHADQRWPLGYRVYEEGAFQSAEDLRRFIARCRDIHMTDGWSETRPVAFHRRGSFTSSRDGFSLSSRFKMHRMTGGEDLSLMGGLIVLGEFNHSTLIARAVERGVAPARAITILEHLRRCGMLDDDPVVQAETGRQFLR